MHVTIRQLRQLLKEELTTTTLPAIDNVINVIDEYINGARGSQVKLETYIDDLSGVMIDLDFYPDSFDLIWKYVDAAVDDHSHATKGKNYISAGPRSSTESKNLAISELEHFYDVIQSKLKRG